MVADEVKKLGLEVHQLTVTVERDLKRRNDLRDQLRDMTQRLKPGYYILSDSVLLKIHDNQKQTPDLIDATTLQAEPDPLNMSNAQLAS